MATRFFHRAPLRVSLVLSLLVFAAGAWFVAEAQRAGRKAQARKVTAEQIRESRERQEERARERMRKRAGQVAPADQGKPVALGPRRASENKPHSMRAPFGVEADDVADYTRGGLYDKPAEAARFFRRKRLPVGDDGLFTMKDLPMERYFKAEAQMREMPLYATALNQFLTGEKSQTTALRQREANEPQQNTWQSLGPGNIGGRTRAMVIHPQDPNIMYAAGTSGGVWKTTNAGQSWTPIGDRLAALTVSALLLDPTNPNVLYVGTGEGFGYFAEHFDNFGDLRGLGIFKSTDAGATFTRLEGANTTDFYFVNDLVASPSNNQRLYAATRTGVWRTTDGGATWTRVLNPLNVDGDLMNGGCLDLAIRTDKMDADVVFASCGTFEQSQLFRTTNGAGSDAWQMVLTEPLMGRTQLALAPSNQDIVYALASVFDPTNRSAYQFALHAVFRSTTGGASGSWAATVRNTNSNKLNTSILSFAILASLTDCGLDFEDDFSAQAWYDLALAVDPLDPQRVWVGAIDLFRSDDGGANWGQAAHVYLDNQAPQYTHTDQHLLLFHPQYNGTTNQTMYVGNDGGLYRTDNARAGTATGKRASCSVSGTAVTWRTLNNGYGVTQFYHGAVYPDGKGYFGGTQDNGTLRGTDDGGVNGWKEIFGGDGGYVAINRNNTNALYTENTGLSIAKSTDGGASFSPARLGLADGGLFIAPYAMDASDPQRLFAGGAFIWRTTNGASQWVRASAITDGDGEVSSIGIAPTDANDGLAGMSDGLIHRSQIALTTTSVTRWASTFPRRGFVSSLAFDPNNKNIAYATYSTFGGQHVWRSADAGATWTAIDGSGTGALPDIPAHTLAIDPNNSARLYLGTDLGIFVSNDTGASWAVENSGFANVITETLRLNIVNGEIWMYAFTYGRGVWRVKLAGAGCDYNLVPATVERSAASATGAINVTAQPGACAWTAASNASWIRITGGGNGNGQASYALDANPSVNARTGTVTLAGRSLVVNQAGIVDVQAPVVTITEPSSNDTVNTTGTVNLRGTATDNGIITSLVWTTDRGNAGIATLTAGNWTATGVPLVTGPNVITVTARDTAGNTARASVRVITRPTLVITTLAGTGVQGALGDNGPASAAQLGQPANLAFDAQGNLFVADMFNDRIRRIALDGTITTVAGGNGNGFSGDGGAATAARLNCPSGIAVDAQGNLYIADSENHRIRRVAAADGIITTYAGTGSGAFSGDDGPANLARVNTPIMVAVQGGNLFIADSLNSRIRRVTLADGVIKTIAGLGTEGFAGDGGVAMLAQLNRPRGVTADAQGNVYIADTRNNRVRKVNAADGVITTVAGTGVRGFTGDGGAATAARIGEPEGVWIDAQNNLLIADTFNDRIRRVSATDGTIITYAGIGITGYGGDGGAASAARFFCPTGVISDAAGRVYIADRDNHRVRVVQPVPAGDTTPPVLTLTQPTTGNTFTTNASPLRLTGTATDNSALLSVQWANDRGGSGLAAGTSLWTVAAVPLAIGLNNIGITAYDLGGNTATITLAVTFAPTQLVTTLAGNGTAGGEGDGGAATLAQLLSPRGVAVDARGNVYVTDATHRVRRITPNGQIVAFAGNGIVGNGGDGGLAVDANLNQPRGLAVDSAGNVYIADTLNNRVRKVTASANGDGRIATIAGTGLDGNRGDGGLATLAELSSPTGVALDSQGNVYISDTNNQRVRKVTVSDGKISTVAGTGEVGFSGDGGPATQAQLLYPLGVALDAQGNLYFIDQGNQRLRRVAAGSNTITTIAGTGNATFNGDDRAANSAALNEPRLLATDAAGDVYIADQGNNRIRKVSLATNTITTVAGSGAQGFGGDNSAPSSAVLAFPQGVALDAQGNLFIADTGNHRIRKVQAASTVRALASVSAASYLPQVAPDSVVAAFGERLAPSIDFGVTNPLPVVLAGVSVRVRDSAGLERLAPLFFVSPAQINYLVPSGTAEGIATATISAADGALITGTLNVVNVAPGLFTANGDGQGVPTAITFRVKADGSQLYENIARFDAATNRFVATPIDLGPESDQVFLILYGTGLRGRSVLTNVTVRYADLAGEVFYVGESPGFIGLDQVNVRLPRGLVGRGDVNVTLTADGRVSNTVRINVR